MAHNILHTTTLLSSSLSKIKNKKFIYLPRNDVAAAAMNGAELLTSWFTPTVLFCVLNAVIGTIFIASTLKPPQSKHDEPPPQLVRVPSFFERVKSFNLSRYQSPEPDPALHAAAATAEEPAAAREEHEPHHVTRSKSEAVAVAAPEVRVLQKSASERVATEEAAEDRRRPATARERAAGEDEAVDERADDFINRFRQQLKLQRLDSILRYKEMLNRGAGR